MKLEETGCLSGEFGSDTGENYFDDVIRLCWQVCQTHCVKSKGKAWFSLALSYRRYATCYLHFVLKYKSKHWAKTGYTVNFC